MFVLRDRPCSFYPRIMVYASVPIAKLRVQATFAGGAHETTEGHDEHRE